MNPSFFRGTTRFTDPRCLGSGSFGSVYAVYDRERQIHVAAKVPHDPAANSLFLFKKEFRALADISHPNLIQFHELVSSDAQWFFTMELIDGIDLLRFLRARSRSVTPSSLPSSEADLPSSSRRLDSRILLTSDEQLRPDSESCDLPPASAPPDLRLVTDTFRQLADGLMAIHHAGLLHMDIKPSNVLVDEHDRIVLLDFGLCIELDPDGTPRSQAAEITGTPAYMAPEHLLDNQHSEASDWYSVGVLLYQVLTGRLPFQGNGMRGLVNKMSTLPPAPWTLLPDLPRELGQLCLDLLNPQPEDRPTGAEFLSRLEHSATQVPVPKGTTRQQFVGRSSELEQLFTAFQELQSGHSGWINLHGYSGMGKTFLLRKFQRELLKKAPDAVVLSGRCYEQEHVPYKALDGIVDGLSQYLGQLPSCRQEALLPRFSHALSQVFPVLRQVSRIAESVRQHPTIADPQELRRRAFLAFREVLRRIGNTSPLVLLMDDLQWGDVDSSVLLSDLLGPPNAPTMLVVACFRTDERATSPILQEFLRIGNETIGRATEIPLGPLPEAQARMLAQSLADSLAPLQEAHLQQIIQESGGNPFFIHELAQHADARHPESAQVTPLETYVQARVRLLPNDSRHAMELIALAGYPIEWSTVRAAAGVSPPGLETIDRLRRAHMIRIRALGGRKLVEPYHDFIRKSVVAGMPQTAQREGHSSLAQAIESSASPDVQAMAIHYQAAEQVQKAVDYLRSAGDQAFQALAFSKAAALYRSCLELLGEHVPEASRIWASLGDALASAGRGKEAGEAYLQAVAHGSPREASHHLRRASQEFLKTGHFREGTTALEGVLASLGIRLAPSHGWAMVSAIYHKLRIRVRGLHYRERLERDTPPEQIERLDSYWTIIQGLATGDLMRVADLQGAHLLLSLQTGEPMRLVRALAYEAIFNTSSGNRGEKTTRKYLDAAMRIAEKLGDPNSMSHAMIAAGIMNTAVGKWRRSAEILDAVDARLKERSSGLAYELRNAQSYALINHYVLGNLQVLAERLPSLMRDARETGDKLFLANLVTGSAFMHHLAQDQPEAILASIQQAMQNLPAEGFFYQRHLELIALANIYLYQGRAQQAYDLITSRWKPLQKSLLMTVQAIRITCLELRGRIALACASRARDPKRVTQWVKEARADIRAIRKEGTDYGAALALRLQLMETMISGRTADLAGIAYLAESAFEDCEMMLHTMTMRRWRGLLKGDALLLKDADQWMLAQGVVSPPRMMAMYLPGPPLFLDA